MIQVLKVGPYRVQLLSVNEQEQTVQVKAIYQPDPMTKEAQAKTIARSAWDKLVLMANTWQSFPIELRMNLLSQRGVNPITELI